MGLSWSRCFRTGPDYVERGSRVRLGGSVACSGNWGQFDGPASLGGGSAAAAAAAAAAATATTTRPVWLGWGALQIMTKLTS